MKLTGGASVDAGALGVASHVQQGRWVRQVAQAIGVALVGEGQFVEVCGSDRPAWRSEIAG